MHTVDDKVVAIVDAYSSGKYLAREFAKHGWTCIHVQSTEFVPDMFLKSFIPADFAENVVCKRDISPVVRRLQDWRVRCVVVGTETLEGVSMTDRLAHQLGLAGNNAETSTLRRNKHTMVESIRDAGLRAGDQVKVADFASAKAWLDKTPHTWPMVVKPLDSGGTNGVYFCNSLDEIEQCFDRLIGTTHLLGAINHELLVQEYLDGTEYVVNTLSWNGIHDVTDIWEVRKQSIVDAACIYDRDRLLPCSGPLQEILCNYTYKVLDAIGHRYGPAHSEMICTAQGPVLLETGARLQGSISPAALSAAIDVNPVERTVAAWVASHHDGRFSPCGYTKHKELMWVQLIARNEGLVVGVPFEETVQKLSSFHSMNLRINRGDYLSRTVDLFSSPGQVFLVHADPEVIENDYQKLRTLEKEGFTLRPPNQFSTNPRDCPSQ